MTSQKVTVLVAWVLIWWSNSDSYFFENENENVITVNGARYRIRPQRSCDL